LRLYFEGDRLSAGKEDNLLHLYIVTGLEY